VLKKLAIIFVEVFLEIPPNSICCEIKGWGATGSDPKSQWLILLRDLMEGYAAKEHDTVAMQALDRKILQISTIPKIHLPIHFTAHVRLPYLAKSLAGMIPCLSV
jgi:hypothetical protein